MKTAMDYLAEAAAVVPKIAVQEAVARRITAQTLAAETVESRLRAMSTFCISAFLILLISSAANIAFAAGSDSDDGYNDYGASADMRRATELVRAEAFTDALPLLQKEVADDPSNADAWNLIGFSSRKLGDYETAEAAYDKALTINPRHRGALEYKGELYLTLDDLAGAEALLARLRKVCIFGCSEVRELRDAIAAYKEGQ